MDTSHIRNFVIIAHIDHGKSTLADRFLELTGTIEKRKMHAQMLDSMELERERGITIKMTPVTMIWRPSRTVTDSTQTDTDRLLYEELTYEIRGAIFEVRKKLGSGHKEIVYQNALEIEFKKRGLKFEKEKRFDVIYEDKKVGVYQPDFLIDDKVLVEIKALPFVGQREEKQIWSYLRGTPYRLALLVNFSPKGADILRIITGPQLSVSSPQESAHQLNLIDTPGHVDFSYEVSRSLAAVEGAILLVDATKGVQAQTLAHLHEAQRQNLVIIPAINKIDLPSARIEEVESEIKGLVSTEKIFKISAKEGTGVRELLEEVVRVIPPPRLTSSKVEGSHVSRALIFDSQYDSYKGVLAYIRVFDGAFRPGDKIHFLAQKRSVETLEVGFFKPDLTPAVEIQEGNIGYIATGLKEPALVRVGDTIVALTSTDLTRTRTDSLKQSVSGPHKSAYIPIKGYAEPKSVVFASVFPVEGVSIEQLADAFAKLKLSDWALTFEPESSDVLGRGFRCGFLGSLHLEIVLERLRREFGLNFIATAPSVNYEIKLKSGETKNIYSASELPEQAVIQEIREPWVRLSIYTPTEYLGGIIQLLFERRGIQRELKHLSASRVELAYDIPLGEIISDFYDKLKSISSGFASLSYEPLALRAGELVRLDILVAGERVPELARVVRAGRAYEEGRASVKRLKEILPRQLFNVSLQAAVGSRVLAREDVKALKKDVTGYLYGGDITRKRKLWEKQKRGKKKLEKLGRVRIPEKVFIELLRRQ